METFIELALIVFVATGVAAVMRLLKQPLVVGYIISGILVGPYAFNILQSSDHVELFSKIGISILLFIVGLSLNPDIIKETGRVSLVTGLGQVLFTSVIGFLIMQGLGFDVTSSVYGAIALTFSSTIIILKLLSDKGDLNKLHGKIAIGFLLVQDLVATVILLVISVLGSGAASGATGELLSLFAKGAVAAFVLYIISKKVLPKLSSYFAESQELLFLFSIAWGLGLSALFAYMGFSIEIGALIAGVTLSVSSYSYEIGSRMKPLRDFFVVLFFILLGSQMIITDIGGMLIPAILLSLFVLIGNPIIVIVLMNLLGYRTKTAFLAGLTVAQISEFSLILMALGLSLGHVPQETVSLVTLVGIITIAGSTYLILYSDALYKMLKGPLSVLEFRKRFKKEPEVHDDAPDIMIFGYDRVGSDFVHSAQAIKAKFLVVDFNPRIMPKLQRAGIPFRFGDAEDVEFLNEVNMPYAKMVVSTIPDFKINKLLVKYYRHHNPGGIIIVLSHDIRHARELYLSGATYVIMPHHLGARHASGMIQSHGFDVKAFEEERNKHLLHLERREHHGE